MRFQNLVSFQNTAIFNRCSPVHRTKYHRKYIDIQKIIKPFCSQTPLVTFVWQPWHLAPVVLWFDWFVLVWLCKLKGEVDAGGFINSEEAERPGQSWREGLDGSEARRLPQWQIIDAGCSPSVSLAACFYSTSSCHISGSHIHEEYRSCRKETAFQVFSTVSRRVPLLSSEFPASWLLFLGEVQSVIIDDNRTSDTDLSRAVVMNTL